MVLHRPVECTAQTVHVGTMSHLPTPETYRMGRRDQQAELGHEIRTISSSSSTATILLRRGNLVSGDLVKTGGNGFGQGGVGIVIFQRPHVGSAELVLLDV